MLWPCSGRAPAKLSLNVLARDGFSETNPPPPTHAHNITVPGAAAGWVDTVETFGNGKVITNLLRACEFSSFSATILNEGNNYHIHFLN